MKKVSTKIYIFIYLVFSSFYLLSCNNSAENKIIYSENETVKEIVKNKEQNITWTFEIESERLSTDISRSKWPLGNEVMLTPDYVRLSKNYQKPVYPELDDFGSLDTSSIKPQIKEKLNSFCTKLSEASILETVSFFNNKYLFGYVFFRKDFEDGWKKNFKNDFPTKKSKTENEEAENKNTIFDKWIFGQPFNGVDVIQIPVRFYCKYGTIDVTIYMNPNGNNEFYQITIDRWERV